MLEQLRSGPLLFALIAVGCLAPDGAPDPDDEGSGGSDESDGGGDPIVGDDADVLAPAGDPQAVGGDRGRLVVATTGGPFTTCYLPSDGTPRCMGASDHGVLGNGTIEPGLITDTPAPVVALDRVRAIVGRDEAFFALRSDGTLWMWGDEDPTPAQIVTADRFRALSAGGINECVVRTDGRVMCAGANGNGQIGDGTTTASTTLKLVTGLTAAVGVTNGTSFTCAVRSAGDVWCWGKNDDGQLGNGDDDDSHVPVQVEGIAGAVAVAADLDVACAVLESGGVSCWGKNTTGALGSPLPASSSTPVTVPGITDAVAIAATGESPLQRRAFCVVRVNGRVSCWGSSFGAPAQHATLVDVGQLVLDDSLQITAMLSDGTAVRTGDYGDSTLTPVPELDTGLVAPRIAAGTHNTCALRADGTVACWGDNDQGELGNGTAIDSSTPVDVVGLTDAIDIAGTMSHACAVMRDGTAKCWGRNNEDQLGDGGAAFPYSTTPVAVAGLAGITAMATSSKSTCAVHESGQVYCWGVNTYGQLGDGTLVDHAAPALVTGLVDAIAIATGGAHYCATRANGGVRCWGYGFSGQLGNGSSGAGSDSSVPVTVKQNALVSLADVTAIAGGNATSCAVRANGTAYCWGGDLHGLGNGAAGTSQLYAQAVSGITTALDVSMGSSSECVLLATGTVKCFGSNQYGELGDWSAPLGTDQYLPRTVGGLFAPLSGVLAIDSGDDHSCAMLSNGTVKCWGWNSSGQLGDGTNTNRSTPVTVLAFP